MGANTLTLIALGIILAGFVYNQFIKPFRHVAATAEGGAEIIAEATIEAAAEATPDAPLALRSWLSYVNGRPDQVPHVAIVGPSGAGKTALATVVLTDRPGQILVITAKEGDHWGGLPYVGIDDDATYTTADRMFAALDAEVKRRLVAVKQKTMTADWLTVALDDYSTLRTVCPAADAPFKLVARLGRALRVRLVVLSDSALVKAWGIEGEGETRSNFAFVKLRRGHAGTVAIDDADVPIDTSPIRQLSLQARLADRQWQPPRPYETELRERLGIFEGIFGAEIAETRAENFRGVETSFRAQESDFTISDLPFSVEEIARITAQIIAGNGKTEVVQAMPHYSGRRHAAYAAFYDRLQRATGA